MELSLYVFLAVRAAVFSLGECRGETLPPSPMKPSPQRYATEIVTQLFFAVAAGRELPLVDRISQRQGRDWTETWGVETHSNSDNSTTR